MENQKNEQFGFLYDERWFYDFSKLQNYDKLFEKYQELFHSKKMTKIDKTTTLANFLEKSKLENTFLKKPPNFIQYYSKIKLAHKIPLNKKILNIFMILKEEEDFLTMETFWKKKDFYEFKDYHEQLTDAFDKEMERIIFKGFFENNNNIINNN